MRRLRPNLCPTGWARRICNFITTQWSYHDSYAGEADFLGQELVYRDRRPVWSMAYYGYLLDPEHVDAVRAGHTVQSALTSHLCGGSVSWRLVADVGEYRYLDTNAGDVGRFTGEEWIEHEGRRGIRAP